MAQDNTGQAEETWESLDENRRRLLLSLGAMSMPMVAGCLGGDDEETPTSTPSGNGDDDTDTPSGNGKDTTDTPSGNGDDDTATPEPSIERHDFTMKLPGGPPAPADAQFNYWAGTAWPDFANGGLLTHDLFVKAHHDQRIYGEMVKEWSYEPGILEFTLHDDFYFWNGDNVTAEALTNFMQWEDYVQGGEELDDHPNLVSYEPVDEYTVRAHLIDAWNESWAIEQTFHRAGVGAAPSWFEPTLDEFDDAANLEEIDDIRTKITETHVHDPNLFYNIPFKWTEAQENRWIGRLRTEDFDDLAAPEEPHFVDQINYLNIATYAVEGGGETLEWFLDGEIYYGSQEEAEAADFDVVEYPYQSASYPLCWLFNCASPPSNNVHFRRAMNYLTNREPFLEEHFEIRTNTTPFLTDARDERFISDDVLESFTDYKPYESDQESAAEEMERGGFEQNSDGQWLFQEGDRAGEPMEWEIWLFGWWTNVENQGGAFLNDAEEFGLDVQYRLDNGLWMRQRGGDFIMDTAYYGGGSPTAAFGQTFDDNPVSGGGHPSPADTFEAPPIGEEWDEDNLEEWDTRAMAQRLPVTADEDRYQRIVDELAWVANQIVPRAPIYAWTDFFVFNNHHFNVSTIDEAPMKHARGPWSRHWANGSAKWLPEDDR